MLEKEPGSKSSHLSYSRELFLIKQGYRVANAYNTGNQALWGERPVETWEGTVRILGCH